MRIQGVHNSNNGSPNKLRSPHNLKSRSPANGKGVKFGSMQLFQRSATQKQKSMMAS